MSPAGLELAFEARGRPQNDALDSVATGSGTSGLAEGTIRSDLVYTKSEDAFQKYLISL